MYRKNPSNKKRNMTTSQKNIRRAVLLVVLSTAIGSTPKPEIQTNSSTFIPYNERWDRQPTTDVRTPHFAFAHNLNQGPLKVFAIASILQGRDVSELMQRLDTQMSVVTWDRQGDANSWGLGDFYGIRGYKDDSKLLQKYFANSMAGPEKFDAMLLTTPQGWNAFPQEARDRIISRVKNDGTGLILVMPFPGGKQPEWTDELRKVCALIDLQSGNKKTIQADGITSKKWRTVGQHPILAGIPLEAMPVKSLTVMPCKLAEKAEVLIETEDGHPVMAVKQVGKGRVITFAFYSDCLTPPMRVTDSERIQMYPYRYWEVWYDLLARSVYWASGRSFKRDGSAVPLAAQGEDADLNLKVQQWKDAQGKVTDWQMDFTPPPVLKHVVMHAPEMLALGKDIEISFMLPQELSKATWQLTAAEPSTTGERTMEIIPLDLTVTNTPSNDQTCSVKIPGERFTKTAAHLQLTASQNGKIVAHDSTTVVFTPTLIWDDFEIHCWGGSCGLPFLRDIERNLEKQLGVTCQMSYGPADMRESLVNGFRNQFYANIRGLHIDVVDLKRAYAQSKDRSLLIRKPSFADPEELATRHQQVLEKFSGINQFKPLSGIIADETSLTSYTQAFDFDFHPANIAAFRKKLEARFKNIAALNQALKTSATSFADIQPPTTDEAKSSGNWGLWNEWRAHNDEMWTETLMSYAAWFDEVCHGIRMSVSGTQVSTPFNGIDWAKLTKAFHSIVGYRGRYQDLERLSFAATGDFKPMSWVGYTNKGLAAHYQMWENLFGGNVGCGVFWWLSMRNPDLTWSQSALGYKPIFDIFKHGISRQFQLAKRDFSPVAVLWSANSQRAAHAFGKSAAFVAAESEVMESLYKAGFDPYFISEEQIIAGDLKSKKTAALFLPLTISLGMGTQPAGMKVWPKINEFLNQNGVVVVTSMPERDEFLQPLTPPAELSDKAIKLASIKNDLQAELAKRGVKPLVTMKSQDATPLETLKTYVYELHTGDKNRGYIVSFLLPPPDMKQTIGPDGVAKLTVSATVGKSIIQGLADCSALKYAAAYEQSTGQRLTGATLPVTLTAAEGKLITLLPYVVKSVTAEVKEANRNLLVSWRINREAGTGGETEPFLSHVIRVDVINAKTGIANPDLGRNITSGSNGQGEVKIPLSLPEAESKWNIVVTDILTGKQVKI